jgi:O-antigen/teichoic acid export membrane protein
MENSSAIKKGALISYLAIFLNIAITFFYTPWMIKKIGVSDYGLYNLVYSFISYFLLDFGLSQAIQRFIAKYRADGDNDKVSKMIGITTRVYVIIDAIIFFVLLILYFFITNIFTGLTPDEIIRVKGLYIIAGIFGVLSFMFKPMAGAMMAFEYFVEEKVLEMVNRVGAVVGICIALALGADVFALLLINGVFSLGTSIIKLIVFKRKSHLNIQWRYFDKGELNDIFSFSMWTFGNGLAQRMRFSLVPSILGVLSNSTEIAIFSMGISLEGMVFTLSSAINGLFLPFVSRMVHRQKREDILNLMIKVGRIQLFIITLLFSGFLIFGQAFIVLWVGKDFSPVYYVLLLLIVSNLVSLTQQIANDLIYVENKIRQITIRIFICSAIGLVIACLLAKELGAIGCAIGTCFGLCAYQLSINRYYHKQLGLDIMTFFKECHVRILPVLVLLTIVFMAIKNYLPLNSWYGLIICCGGYGIVFLITSYFFLFTKEERALLRSFSNK